VRVRPEPCSHRRVVANSSDLTDAQWSFLEPLLLISSKRGPKHGDDLRTSSMRCSTSRTPGANGVSYPWSSALDQSVVPISSVVEERNVEPSSHRSARLVAHGARPKGTATLDGRYRHAPRSRGFERRCDLSQPGRPYGRTNGAKRIVCVDVTGLPLCVRVVPASTPRPVPSNRYSTTSPARARTNDWSSCSLTGALRSRRPSDSRTNSTTKFAEWDGTSPHATSTGPKSFVPSVTLGASRWPTAISCVGDVWRAASKTP